MKSARPPQPSHAQHAAPPSHQPWALRVPAERFQPAATVPGCRVRAGGCDGQMRSRNRGRASFQARSPGPGRKALGTRLRGCDEGMQARDCGRTSFQARSPGPGRKALGTRLRGRDEQVQLRDHDRVSSLMHARMHVFSRSRQGGHTAPFGTPAQKGAGLDHKREFDLILRRTRAGGCPVTLLFLSTAKPQPAAGIPVRSHSDFLPHAGIKARSPNHDRMRFQARAPRSGRKALGTRLRGCDGCMRARNCGRTSFQARSPGPGRKALGTRLRGCDEQVQLRDHDRVSFLMHARMPAFSRSRQGGHTAPFGTPACGGTVGLRLCVKLFHKR